MTKWTVIVPSNRPDEMMRFFVDWSRLFEQHDVCLVVMWDSPKTLWKGPKPDYVVELCWKDIKAEYIPTKTDMVRSWAFKWAYENTESQYFLTLDDDVRPSFTEDIFVEYKKVFDAGAPLSEYFDVGQLTSSSVQMRGYPYKDRKKQDVAVQYGGWNGVLDYDAATQISTQPGNEYFGEIVITLPKGTATTCCIMNCAWKRHYTPIMWQLPMLEGRYNRVGDIWSGLLIKKTLDAVDSVMVINGKAQVRHQRASNVYESLKKEAPSVYINDHLWENLSNPELELEEPTLMEAYRCVVESMAEYLETQDKEYAVHFRKAYNEWEKLIQ